MFKFLSFVSKNLILPIPVMMVLGFGFGLLAPTGWLKLRTFLMVYPMMVTFKLTKVLEGGDSKAQLVAQLINFGIIPLRRLRPWPNLFPDSAVLRHGPASRRAACRPRA